MEAKAMFSVMAIVMIAVGISQTIMQSSLIGMLLIMAIGLIVLGDFLIGIKISDFKALYDPTPRGWELMELQLLDGKAVFMNTKKGAHGKRSFRINNEDASVINDGKANFTLMNGNRGFRAHENYDGNIDPFRAKALEQMEGKDVKEIYYQAREKIQRGEYE